MKIISFSNPALIRFFRIIVLLVIVASAHTVFSQHVTILPSGITPNQSGAIPRLSYEGIMALPNPQNGDIAYDITFSCMRFYKKNRWVKMNDNPAGPSSIGWQIGGANTDEVRTVTTDASGNVYITGNFRESAVFDETEVTEQTSNVTTLFLAKYTNKGSLLWVQKVAYSSIIYANELIIDASGNLYMTGYFFGNAVFGANTLGNMGQSDIFLAKFSNDGVLQWLQQGGGLLEDKANDLAIDTNGNLYITGVVLGNVTFGGVNYIGSAVNTVFIAKYKNDGTFQWIRRGATGGNDKSSAIVADANGKVTIVGNYTNTVSFGNTSLTSEGMFDIFLARYDSNGNFVWAKSYGGASYDYAIDMNLDANNNIYLAGTFTGMVNFSNLVLTSAGGADIFIAKLNAEGTILWLKKDGGVNTDFCHSMTVDSAENVYITGSFTAPTVFGGVTLNSNNSEDVYITKYNSGGNFVWTHEYGGRGQAFPLKISAGTGGNVYSVGNYVEDIVLDEIKYISRGGFDGFIVRLTD